MDPAESPGWLICVLLAVIVLVVLYRAAGPRADFVVRFHSGRLDIKGKFPQAARGGFEGACSCTIFQARSPRHDLGAPWKGRRLTLRFHGPLDKREQQRIRNLLISRL